jgi:tripartite-type tricarboxylate transporter receptor subunit TctC
LRVIFPFAAGGVGDALSRIMADELSRALGEPAIMEARPGAGGQLGLQAVRNAAPDGRTLLMTPIAPIVIHPIIYPNLPYDPFRDLTPISQIATFDFCLAVGPATPATTLAEFITWVKQDPRRGSYGSPGAGTLPHFFGLMMGRASGIEVTHVAYRGSAPALTDLIGGQVPMVMTTTSDVVEFAKAGRVRVLAVSGQTRSPFLSDVPTFTELGVPVAGNAWYAAYTGAGVPQAQVERLNRAIVSAVTAPATRDRILGLSLVPTGTSGADLAAIQRADFEHWGPAVRASGFKPD